MMDWLYAIDVAVFHFINVTLANPISDVVFPYITDYDKQLPIRIVLIATWVWLLIKGGKRGRTVAIMLIPMLVVSDQVSSSLLKPLIGRIRPCHALSPEDIHLLVGCGGLSFPSSHAVNNFAVATMFVYYYPRIRIWLLIWASLIALSRVVVGVHYPADVIGGAVIGILIAVALVNLWKQISKRFLPWFALAYTKRDNEFWRRFSLSVLSGVMLGFSFPPSQFGILACFGLIPMLVALDDVKRTRLTFGLIYAGMLVFHMITLNWTGGYAHMNDPYMMIAGAVTMTVHPLFYFLPFGFYLLVKNRLGKNVALAALPFLWVAYEYTHTLSEWSFPWITLGNSQSYDITRIQFIEYTGVIGLSFWILVLNVLGFFLYKSLLVNGITFPSKLNLVMSTTILLVYFLPTVHGRIVLSNNPQSTNPNPQSEITVGMVQANVDPWEKWEQSGFETIDLYLRMTDSLVRNASRTPDIILWPETAMPYYLLTRRNESTLNSVREKITEIGVPVLFGLPHAVYYDDTTLAPPSAKRMKSTGERYDAFNATAFIQPGTQEIPWYGKMKMVPIAERVPYADAFYFFDFLRWGVGIGGWQIGRDSVIFHEKKTGARFSSMICYESVYPEFVASFVKKGAEFLTIVTIDSWWDLMSGAYQHHQYAIFRAIENRRWIARCAVGGFSSYIDPSGDVYDKTNLFTQAILTKTIERRSDLTFYTRHGEWVGKLAAICSGIFILLALIRCCVTRPE